MADIRFTCDACQHSVVADASASGSEIRCPGCQKPLIVPAPSLPQPDAAHADELPPVSQAGPAPAPQPAAELPEIEGYEVLAKLGEGGMGAVYRARQPLLNRVVALKVMSRRYSDDPSFVARFIREAAAAANLSHRNMVQVFTAGESNGIRFIAMEFVEGRTLSQHIKKHGRLDAREAVAVTIYVAQALQYAWDKARLIHRDIKPENIFLSYGGEVKVGDLGLAKSVGESNTVLTTTGVTVGSPHYISPEQARAAKDMDFRADIYSLGCTLYHMLTGRPPFDAEDILSIMMKHVSDPAPAITELWPECPRSLATLVGKMLAKDRGARPASYEKLVEELVRIHDELKSSPSPSPISPVEPNKSFVAKTIVAVRRKPPLMLGAAVAVVAAVMTFAGFWWWSSGKNLGSVDIVLTTEKEAQIAPQPPSSMPSSLVAPTSRPTEALAVRSTEPVPTPATVAPPSAVQADQLWTNSLGMKFVPVPGTKVMFCTWLTRVQDFEAFVKATGYDATKEMFSVRNRAWKQHGDSWRSPGFVQGPTHPVCGVNWDDAQAFCKWLTEQERRAGLLPAGSYYRLPTDDEWSVAVGLPPETGSTPEEKRGRIEGVYPWGIEWPPPPGAGNFAGEELKDNDWLKGFGTITGYNDGYPRTSPAGSFKANRYGLFDMAGNVQEWCEDWFNRNQTLKLVRGGSWGILKERMLLSSYRLDAPPKVRFAFYGFRAVLAGGGVSTVQSQSAATSAAASSSAPTPAVVAPQSSAQPAQPWTNSLGMKSVPVPGTSQPSKDLAMDLGDGVSMKLVLIPAGKFIMGSPEGEDVRRKDETQHEVTLSQPFYMGVTHVTVEQFAAFVKASGYKTDAEREGYSEAAEIKDGKLVATQGKNVKLIPRKVIGASWRNPGFEQKGDHPVVEVSWNDAVAFCDWLSKKSGRLVALPTEAQWEYACRAGTKTAWPWGDNPDGGKGWANGADQSFKRILPRNAAITCFDWDDGFVFTSPVGRFKANAFGLFDMIGNAAHWCQDRYADYERSAVTDPTGPATGTNYVVRGGSWNNFQLKNCRSAARYHFAPDYRNDRYGFRVVAEAASSTSAAHATALPNVVSNPPAIVATPEKPWTNSLGMKFVPVPGTKVLFCIWKTRVRDFEAFVQATSYDATQGASTLATDGWKQRGGSWKSPGFAQTAEHPVCCVSWEDARAFCKWLTEMERAAGRLRADQEYRLPTDAEWSVAVGLGEEPGGTPKDKSGNIENVYPWGTEWPPPAGAGNYGGEETRPFKPVSFGVLKEYRDDYPHTSPVGSFKANRFGLYDLGGSLWEWCEDLYDGLSGERVLRGASWSFFVGPGRRSLLSSFRFKGPAGHRQAIDGFRCVLAPAGVATTQGLSNSVNVSTGSNAAASWVIPTIPQAGANGWITLFDGERLFGCNPTDEVFTSGKAFLRNGCLWMDNAQPGLRFDRKARNAALRARVKKVSGQNITLCIGPYWGWFNGGKSFGITEYRNGRWPVLVKGNSSSKLPDFFDMEFTVIGGTLALTANGATVATTQAAPIEDDAWLVVSTLKGLSEFKRIELKLLDK